jgi:hypothetical protein
VSFNIFNIYIYIKKNQIMATDPIRISLNGQLFSSINQAAKSTKISTRQIKKKLKDLNDPSCFELIDLSPEEASLLPSFYKRRGKDRNPRATGEAHGNYVHGLGRTRDWDSSKYAAWKQGVLQKYGFACIVTGDTTHLQCHHMEGWWFEPGRYDIDNGVPLTTKIHKKFHQIYGSGDNTKVQFAQFLQNEYGIDIERLNQGNHEPSLTLENIQKRQKTYKERAHQEFLELVHSRNHRILDRVYENIDSVFVIECLTHQTIHETTARNYKRSRTGMPCCGRSLQSQAAKKR